MIRDGDSGKDSTKSQTVIGGAPRVVSLGTGKWIRTCVKLVWAMTEVPADTFTHGTPDVLASNTTPSESARYVLQRIS